MLASTAVSPPSDKVVVSGRTLCTNSHLNVSSMTFPVSRPGHREGPNCWINMLLSWREGQHSCKVSVVQGTDSTRSQGHFTSALCPWRSHSLQRVIQGDRGPQDVNRGEEEGRTRVGDNILTLTKSQLKSNRTWVRAQRPPSCSSSSPWLMCATLRLEAPAPPCSTPIPGPFSWAAQRADKWTLVGLTQFDLTC